MRAEGVVQRDHRLLCEPARKMDIDVDAILGPDAEADAADAPTTT